MLETHFGPPEQWPDQDLVGWTDDLTPGMAWAGYRSGVFPMPLPEVGHDDAVGWFSPVERATLRLDDLRVTRSLRKMARRYTTTIDTDFVGVLAGCADPTRDHGWIDQCIADVYTDLHLIGVAHSVETWDAEGRLVGGLYGVHCGGLFAGESMFHDAEHGRDASKVALVRLVVELRRQGIGLLDVQWLTGHLASLGARATTRREYLEALGDALDDPHEQSWETGAHMSGDALLAALGGDTDA